MTSNGGRSVRIGDVLAKADSWVIIDPASSYKQITVRLWGQGVVLRNTVMGSEIGGAKRIRVSGGQFILSRIDARNGAMGVIPESLDGGVVSNDFPVFDAREEKILPGYLGWLAKTRFFINLCQAASEGTTNRVRLKEDRFLSIAIRLPPLEEQARVVERLDAIAGKIEEARTLRRAAEKETRGLLRAAFQEAVDGCGRQPMGEVAPLVRRPVSVRVDETYRELGIRSFGGGTFHKPPVSGGDLGSKRVFQIVPGDLLLSNVFAWEGAVAVAGEADRGRVGSHRFISCVPEEGIATAQFLRFYFLTTEGLRNLGEASPGGAGRNRTLGLQALARLSIPVPRYDKQVWFDALQGKVNELRQAREQAAAEFGALLPSVLERAVRAEL